MKKKAKKPVRKPLAKGKRKTAKAVTRKKKPDDSLPVTEAPSHPNYVGEQVATEANPVFAEDESDPLLDD